MFDSDSIVNYNDETSSVYNTSQNIYLSTTILNEFTCTYYDGNYDHF